MTNTNKLRVRLLRQDIPNNRWQKELGISTATFCNKLNNRTEFKASRNVYSGRKAKH